MDRPAAGEVSSYRFSSLSPLHCRQHRVWACWPGYGTSVGGYGEGAISYVDPALLPGHVTDADIQAALSRLLPVNAVAWLRIN